MATNRTEQKTANLRFVERDGKRILQQEVIVSELTDDGGSIHYEWHDIPLVAKQERHEWSASTRTRYFLYESFSGVFRDPALLQIFLADDDKSAIAAVIGVSLNSAMPLMLYAESEPNSTTKQAVATLKSGTIEWQRSP